MFLQLDFSVELHIAKGSLISETPNWVVQPVEATDVCS